MDIAQIAQVLLGTPTALVLLYLLEQERRAHVETRRARDEDWRTWVERFALLSERVTEAVERLDLPGPR